VQADGPVTARSGQLELITADQGGGAGLTAAGQVAADQQQHGRH